MFSRISLLLLKATAYVLVLVPFRLLSGTDLVLEMDSTFNNKAVLIAEEYLFYLP